MAELAERAVARHRELTRNKERIAAARQLVRDKRFVEAIPLFEAILAVEPANGFAHRMLAWSLSRSGSIHRAWQHYNQAVALNPDDFETYANMGAIALSQARMVYYGSTRFGRGERAAWSKGTAIHTGVSLSLLALARVQLPS